MGWTHLRPTDLARYATQGCLATAREQGAFYSTVGTGRVAMVDEMDVAAVAAVVLTNPTEHAGKIYHLTGPAAYTYPELATQLSAALGKDVRYVNVTPAQAKETMLKTARVAVNPRIRVRLHTELRAIAGGDRLERITLENTATGEHAAEASSGAFIFIGATPCTDFLGPGILRDEKNFVLAGAQAAASGKWPLERAPGALETTCPGIFVAGDCRSRTTKRVAFAVGDGALAVTGVHDLLGTYA